MGDPPIEYVWHDGPVSAGLPVTQVYGWLLCPATGRVLIQEQDDGTFSLNWSTRGFAGCDLLNDSASCLTGTGGSRLP